MSAGGTGSESATGSGRPARPLRAWYRDAPDPSLQAISRRVRASMGMGRRRKERVGGEFTSRMCHGGEARRRTALVAVLGVAGSRETSRSRFLERVCSVRIGEVV